MQLCGLHPGSTADFPYFSIHHDMTLQTHCTDNDNTSKLAFCIPFANTPEKKLLEHQVNKNRQLTLHHRPVFTKPLPRHRYMKRNAQPNKGSCLSFFLFLSVRKTKALLTGRDKSLAFAAHDSRFSPAARYSHKYI